MSVHACVCVCVHCTAKQLKRMMIVKEVETLTIRITKRIYSLRAHVRVCVCKRVHPHVFGYLRIYFYLDSCCTKAKSEN